MTPQSAPRRPMPNGSSNAGPVGWTLIIVLGLIGSIIMSWFIGVVIEMAGCYSIWADNCMGHSRDLVAEDLNYIAAAPRSILFPDTVAVANWLIGWVAWPYQHLQIEQVYNHYQAVDLTQLKGIRKALAAITKDGSRLLLISQYVLQDTMLRFAIAVFAAPAFVLACLLGAVDGLVRRDLRKWGGGRESSFVYHNAKRATTWSCVAGFTLYLVWPFGGFNPAYMVLIFTVLVAFSLSTALASFKKYL